MPDLNFILIFDQNDGFDHFLIFTPFLRLIFAIYSATLLHSYIYVCMHATRAYPYIWMIINRERVETPETHGICGVNGVDIRGANQPVLCANSHNT